jgi:pimeloyl-ACP methyl ester carboxylesterase|tara:strand:- start:1662 stop:2429 length:768 start_codon:yes stop_codon:yes gene_type:complete
MPPTNSPNIYVETGGEGETTYLLLHGQGATGATWHNVREIIEKEKAGQWVIPDMRGHGRSDWSQSYGFGEHANDIANLIRDCERVVILGHSMGGIIGLALATGWFGVDIAGVVVIGTILDWTEEHTAGMNAIGGKPTRWFETRDEAIERYLKVSGLFGIISPDDPMAAAGIYQEGDKFRLAADNAVATVGGSWMGVLLPVPTCPIVLAVGEHDKMVDIKDYRAVDKNAVTIPNVGHNTHVEDPQATWDLVKKLGV